MSYNSGRTSCVCVLFGMVPCKLKVDGPETLLLLSPVLVEQ